MQEKVIRLSLTGPKSFVPKCAKGITLKPGVLIDITASNVDEMTDLSFEFTLEATDKSEFFDLEAKILTEAAFVGWLIDPAGFFALLGIGHEKDDLLGAALESLLLQEAEFTVEKTSEYLVCGVRFGKYYEEYKMPRVDAAKYFIISGSPENDPEE
jgi:hypothetical protein